MSLGDVRRSNEPMDRLSELSARMTEVLDEPENLDIKAIVFLDTADSGGIQLHGYDDEAEAMAHLFVHMKAVFQAMGKDLDFIGVPESPEGLT